MKTACLALAVLLAPSVAHPAPASDCVPQSYFDHSGQSGVQDGGVKMIPITTPKGTFNVWTQRIGNNPRIKVLLLHGGPGFDHEYLEAFSSFFPGAGIEFYYYDQLGSAFSDQPDDSTLWNIPRFVDEVEQVRKALGLGPDNFYLYGHSWGGILGIEYALAHQDQLKGLIISNMMASIPAYGRYAHDVLMPAMDQTVLKEILQLEAAKDYDNPRYEELLMGSFYPEHILRMPPEQWPNPVMRAFMTVNKSIYVPMQGPSELGASGKLEHWDRMQDLPKIKVPTLVIGAKYGTMDPAYLKRMSEALPKGRFLLCPNGSHLAMYDDQQTYFDGLIRFIRDVDAGR